MNENSWTIDGLTYTEIAADEYNGNHCRISAGLVEGHDHDALYFRLEKEQDPDREVFILVRPDEMAALASVCSETLREWLLLTEKTP